MPVPSITVEAYQASEPRTMIIGGGIVRSGGGRVATTVTDEAGKYVIKGLNPGSYFIRTERDPESGSYRRSKVDAGQDSILDFIVPTNAVISGRVFDQIGDPVAGANVWLLKTEYQHGVLRQVVTGPRVTKTDGAYTFDYGLEGNRRYYILVDRSLPKELFYGKAAELKDREPIEVPTYYPSAINLESAIPIVLQVGERREKVDIKVAIAPFYCIDGKMPDSGYFTIQDSQITGTSLTRARRNSGDDGKYRVCGLPPGQYKLFTEHTSTEFTIATSDLQRVGPSTDSANLRIQVDWDDPSSAPQVPKLDARSEATLRKIASAMGLGVALSDDDLKGLARRVSQPDSSDTRLKDVITQMLDETSAADVGYLMGSLMNVNFMLSVTLTGAADTQDLPFGLAVPSDSPISHVPPSGDYAVEFQTFGKTVAYAKDVTFNGVKPADGILRITPGAANTLHVVMATDVATISVIVSDIEGKPVPNATVILISDSVTSPSMLSRVGIHGISDQNGSYTSQSVPPGKYRVLATTHTVRFNVPDDLERMLLVLFQAKDVEVAPKATLQVAVAPIAIY